MNKEIMQACSNETEFFNESVKKYNNLSDKAGDCLPAFLYCDLLILYVGNVDSISLGHVIIFTCKELYIQAYCLRSTYTPDSDVYTQQCAAGTSACQSYPSFAGLINASLALPSQGKPTQTQRHA